MCEASLRVTTQEDKLTCFKAKTKKSFFDTWTVGWHKQCIHKWIAYTIEWCQSDTNFLNKAILYVNNNPCSTQHVIPPLKAKGYEKYHRDNYCSLGEFSCCFINCSTGSHIGILFSFSKRHYDESIENRKHGAGNGIDHHEDEHGIAVEKHLPKLTRYCILWNAYATSHLNLEYKTPTSLSSAWNNSYIRP